MIRRYFKLKFDLFTLEKANKQINFWVPFLLFWNNFLTKFKSIMGKSHDIFFVPAGLILLEDFKRLQNKLTSYRILQYLVQNQMYLSIT